MVDAIDPARLDSLPADVRAAFEAQAKALAETSFQLDIERKTRLHLQAVKSDLEAKNSDLAAENDLLKEANARLEHLVHELAGRGSGRDRRSSIQISSSWSSKTSRSRSQKFRNPSDTQPERPIRPPMRPMSNIRSAAPAPCRKSCRASSR